MGGGELTEKIPRGMYLKHKRESDRAGDEAEMLPVKYRSTTVPVVLDHLLLLSLSWERFQSFQIQH